MASAIRTIFYEEKSTPYRKYRFVFGSSRRGTLINVNNDADVRCMTYDRMRKIFNRQVEVLNFKADGSTYVTYE